MTIEPELLQRFGLGAIDQISFAVPDMADAIPRYTTMFGDPFAVIDVPGLEVLVDGEPSLTTLRLGFGATGDLEVELVEVLDGLWPTRDWLGKHGEGLHHLRYPVDDVAASRAEMVAAGFQVTVESVNGDFVYLESPPLNGMTVELIQAAAA
jgi:catechol 2,3-dioxygenase-like lactoylglutathione lyase family enzyme